MKNALKIKSFLVILFIVMIINGCHNTQKAKNTDIEQPAIQKIKSRGKLIVGTTGDYKPLTFKKENGEYWGLEIDIAQTIAKRLGVKLVFYQTKWQTLTADVLKEPQTFDFTLGGITITGNRKNLMDMSDGYLANGKTILCRTEDADRYKSLSGINRSEVRVMVNPGGLNEQFALKNLKNAKIIIHEKNAEIPNLVAEGKADIMITEITEAPYYVKNDSRLSAPLISTPFTHGEIGILMRKNKTGLLEFINSHIREMKADGSLKILTEKYGLTYVYD